MTNKASKVSVIIGGGNGIGAACARVMASAGWHVVIADLNLEVAQKVAREVDGHAYAADISDLSAMEELATQIECTHGPVHAVVVSAAMFQDKLAPAEFPIELYRKVLDVNITGTFISNKVFGEKMAARGTGSIVNVASDSALGGPLHAYGPSKGAVITMTKTLAGQFGPSGVRVNSVSPGQTMTERVLARPPGRYAANLEDLFALGRRIQPEEIAEAVAFLASNKASAITGIDLLVDCGLAAGLRWGMYGGLPSAVSATNVE